MHSEVINHYLNTILRSKLLLDEDMEQILNNCKFCGDNKTKYSWFANCKRVTALCLWGISVYKYRLFGFIATTPFAVLSATAFYNEYKVKCYKNNVQTLIEIFSKLHKINREIIKYLKVRELFNKFSQHISKHIETIFNQEIALIEDLMSTTEIMCGFCEVIQPETWKVDDLHLNSYNSQEECYENFLKLHDVIILTVSKFLATIAITVTLKQQTQVLDKIIPNALKLIKNYINAINNKFNYSARCLTTLEKPIINDYHGDGNNKRIKPTIKLEHSLSKLLTHLQLTFENAHQIYCKFDEKLNIEDLAEQVFALQEQFTLCEQSLDQFCGIYGILVKKSVSKPLEKVDEKLNNIDESNKIVVKNDADGENLEAGDEEYEMYVGEDSDEEDDDEFNKKSDFSEEKQSSACLLLVLQELKDRLKERQIMRAKKLGLPLPETERTVEEKKESPPPKPPILVACPEPKAEFTAEIGTSSFASAIKLMAQQRHCEEDVFEDEIE